MMPIRDVVIFPHMMTPFVVGRESSVRALEEAGARPAVYVTGQHQVDARITSATEMIGRVRHE